ncbi:hypothetical protein VCR17J2_20170 [Vibrio coralliirubri]|nr:hypothetical protein VCR17J2_20170 [Vibrio coralliirubri]
MQRAAQQKWTFNLKRQEQLALALKFQASQQQVLHLVVVALLLLRHRLEMIVVVRRTVEKKTVSPQLYLSTPNFRKVGWLPEWTAQLVQEK